MSFGEIIALSFLVWNVCGAVVSIPIFLDDTYYGYDWKIDRLNPIYIYQHTKCNLFGVICLTIIVNLLFPLQTIYYWLYKLCTFGRK